MNTLKILKLYEEYSKEYDYNFLKGIYANITDMDIFEKLKWAESGLKLIEDTLPYIEKIYENPNRLIVNEEELVKIELAKKVTVESIKHLAKHTNFIKSVNEKQEVEPSKILNINKVESFDTYENRVIYTLIQNINFFIYKTKEAIEKIKVHEENNDRILEYSGASIQKEETIEVNLQIKTKITKNGLKNKIRQKINQIHKIEKRIIAITNYEAYKVIDKKGIPLIKPPLRKTNLILKNVNFNYAMKLWDYLQENMTKFDEKNDSEEGQSEEKKKLIEIFNEIFLLDFIAMNHIKDDEIFPTIEDESDENKLLIRETTPFGENMDKIEINQTIKKDLKKEVLEKQIREIFDKYFEKYMERLQDKK